jgi:hypothetical protein
MISLRRTSSPAKDQPQNYFDLFTGHFPLLTLRKHRSSPLLLPPNRYLFLLNRFWTTRLEPLPCPTSLISSQDTLLCTSTLSLPYFENIRIALGSIHFFVQRERDSGRLTMVNQQRP